MHIYIKNKKLNFNNYKAKCSIGKRGIGNKRTEGDQITPRGKFKIKFLFYRKDRVSKLKSKIKKITIKKNMGWCDDPNSKKYNTLSYMDILKDKLKVMDSTALSLSMDNNIPMVVFNISTVDNIKNAIMGKLVGTLVH